MVVLQGAVVHCSFINCTYNDPYNYQCEISINNTEGFNDFKEITGKHLDNLTDSDVKHINGFSSITSLNIPAIICERFFNATVIQFYYNTIERIDSYSFKVCENLQNLRLHSCQISTIDEQAFANNYKLQYLELSYNKISTLPECFFSSQPILQFLYLNGNQLLDIPEYIFKGLTNLTELNLSENNLQKFRPEWFVTLNALTHLDISNSNFTEELSRNLFGSLKNLNYIGLRSSKLKVIHADIFGESLSISQIDLGYNRIYAIDEKFLENTEPSYIQLNGNICADISISDYSMSRKDMRAAMKECFEFYKMLIGKLFFFNFKIYFCEISRFSEAVYNGNYSHMTAI